MGTGFSIDRRMAAVLFALFLSTSCATKKFEPQAVEPVAFQQRAETQLGHQVQVRVSVPSAEESLAFFGIPVYDRGIQPVWLEIENRGDEWVRFAPSGVDREYFSPLEVSYMHRKGYSGEEREKLDFYLFELAMPRVIGAGRTESGFVFTNFAPGTKAVNIDVYGDEGGDESFIFFVNVPGFEPDHAAVDFEGLYPPDQIRDYDLAGFRDALAALPCCTTAGSSAADAGATGRPFNVVLVGEGTQVLHALLRARWDETALSESAKAAVHLFDRPPDAVFRRRRSGPGGAVSDSERNELRLWLAPMTVEGQSVWIAEVNHFIGRETRIEQLLAGSLLDPNVDDGRDYMLQIMWYGQGLQRFAWLGGGLEAPVEAPRRDFDGARFFTDGWRVVLWLSGEPVSLLETDYVAWDAPPDQGGER